LPFLQNCEIADTIVRYNVAVAVSANISVRLMKTRSKYDGDIVMAIIKTRVYNVAKEMNRVEQLANGWLLCHIN